MRFLQVAHALTQHDGASDFVRHLDAVLRELGYETAMFAHKIDPHLAGTPGLRPMTAFDGTADDIVIYHMTTGTSFNRWVARYPHRIVLYYHNITPARYFFGNAWGSWWKCIQGRRQLRAIAKNTFFAWGASEYSCNELRELGVPEAKRLPIIVEPARMRAHHRVDALWQRYHDGRRNILVVGRGVPHKKQDEAIAAIRWYRDHIDASVRLILVGTMKPSFQKKLEAMIARDHLEDTVLLTGGVSDDELTTWYELADALLSLSEHEGFCIPLIEAMAFDKPVFAYAAAAVPETVGDAGILLTDKTPAHVAAVLHDTLADPARLAALHEARQRHLASLSYERVRAQVADDAEHILALWRQPGRA